LVCRSETAAKGHLVKLFVRILNGFVRSHLKNGLMQNALVNIMLSPALERDEASTTPKLRKFTMRDCHGFSRRNPLGRHSLRFAPFPEGIPLGQNTFFRVFEIGSKNDFLIPNG